MAIQRGRGPARQNPSKRNPKPRERGQRGEGGAELAIKGGEGCRTTHFLQRRPSMGKRPKLDRKPLQSAADAHSDAPSAINSRLANPPELAQLPPRPGHDAAMAPGPLLPDAMNFAAMVRPAEAVAASANAANQSLNPVGMQIYWNLSSLDMAVREAAALALVRELRAKQDEFAAGGGRGGVAEVWREVRCWCFAFARFWRPR